MGSTLFSYICDESALSIRILHLINQIYVHHSSRIIHPDQHFHFMVYNDSIAVIVKENFNTTTFLIDTFYDYELMLDFVDTTHNYHGTF